MHLLATGFGTSHALLRPLAGANNPEFPRPSLRNGQLCRCLRWRQKHVGLLSHRKCLVRARCRVFCGLLVQRHESCRLKGSRTQHLHRLQVASVACGLSQSVPLVSFMPDVCGPKCLVNNIWSLVQTHIFVHAVRGVSKACSSCYRCQAWRS